jgi:hypothetical protein
MLHEALKRAGHVVPASEITVMTRRTPRPMRPVVYGIVLSVVIVLAAGGALVLYRQEPSYAGSPAERGTATRHAVDASTEPAPTATTATETAATGPVPSLPPNVSPPVEATPPSPAPAVAERTEPPPPAPVAETPPPPAAPVAAAPSPAPPSPATPSLATPGPAPAEPSPDVRLLLARGDSLLRTGDLAAARLFYQRAAEQGHGAGALGVAKTYDPLFLEQAGFRHLRGDAAAATSWYRKAEAAGDADAPQRLARLLAGAPAR